MRSRPSLVAAALMFWLVSCDSPDENGAERSSPDVGGSSATAGTATGSAAGSGSPTGGSIATGGGAGSPATVGGVGNSGVSGAAGAALAGAGSTASPGGTSGGLGSLPSAGGTNAGAAGAAGGASDDYNPCPPVGQPCLVMPLGDSITQGKTGSSDEGGYREPLFRLAHAAGQSLQLVGSQMNGPATVDGVAWPRNHEGYSGYTIDYTSINTGGRGALTRNELTPNNIKTYKPNIVLLMIGTNDLNNGEDMPAARLARLVDTILNADPQLLLFVTQIIPAKKATPDSYNQLANTYNAAMVGLVSERAAAGKHVRLMDMNTPFTSTANYSTTLLADKLHPNDAGYKLMGQTWYAALSALLH